MLTENVLLIAGLITFGGVMGYTILVMILAALLTKQQGARKEVADAVALAELRERNRWYERLAVYETKRHNNKLSPPKSYSASLYDENPTELKVPLKVAPPVVERSMVKPSTHMAATAQLTQSSAPTLPMSDFERELGDDSSEGMLVTNSS